MEQLDGKSRMRRESHVRFCEGPGVQFPRATRQCASTLLEAGHTDGAATVVHPNNLICAVNHWAGEALISYALLGVR